MSGKTLTRLADFFTGHFPKRENILGTYAVIVMLVYGWTLLTSFYRLPSWMYYLSLSQILSIYAYAFPLNFLESVIMLALVLFLHYALFPISKKREEFSSRSILTALFLLGSSATRLALYKEHVDSAAFISGQALWWSVTAAVALPLILLAPKSAAVRGMFDGFAERALIFLYIYLPLTAVALLVVAARNLY